MTIERALILAAGLGTRLRDGSGELPKPLHLVAGETLLSRTVRTLAEAGVTRIWVVVGYRADELERAIEALRQTWSPRGVELMTLYNEQYTRSNGVSVLCADGVIDGPFLLSMSDHVYEPAVARVASAADMDAGDLWLCVDRRLDEIFDMDDATKVRTVEGRIVDIGKQLVDFDCVDCGVFAVNGALLAALRSELDRRGDCSLSDGVRELAARGRAHTLDIGTAFWQDVDTPPALLRAEQELARLAGGTR